VQKIHTTKEITTIKDYSKGQKIVAALYLVSNHLADQEPLKTRLRTEALALLSAQSEATQSTVGTSIIDLLKVAFLANLISDQNISILCRELTAYLSPQEQGTNHILDPLFLGSDQTNPLMTTIKKSHALSFMSDNLSLNNTTKNYKNDAIIENKNKRQSQILSLINERKSLGIKDIASLFTDISEKTIQRELISLVEAGKITKRGSKRWSIYLAVG
jgi:hypothetical protein